MFLEKILLHSSCMLGSALVPSSAGNSLFAHVHKISIKIQNLVSQHLKKWVWIVGGTYHCKLLVRTIVPGTAVMMKAILDDR